MAGFPVASFVLHENLADSQVTAEPIWLIIWCLLGTRNRLTSQKKASYSSYYDRHRTASLKLIHDNLFRPQI